MIDKLANIGDETYQSWDDAQRRKEIGNLVQGFKNGLPVQVLCQLATSIAGSSELAKEHISAFLTLEERKAIIKKESTGSKELRTLLEATLL
jgi:hypothetical protein